MGVWRGQPFTQPCLFPFSAQLSHSWINGFDLCLPPGGGGSLPKAADVGVQVAAGRTAPASLFTH